jgi:hypothetical protein
MARYRQLTFELLEDRAVPTIFGTPWADALHLTLSFAPDRTTIAAHQSNLFQALNALEPAAVWQQEILAALQTWAAYANINVGAVADGGQAFGTPGLTQGDPRFGDIRIGGQPETGVLAVSVPPDPYLSGTWAGDILINTNYAFDQANTTDLYSVMLHEFGHVLGLSDSTNPNSVMYKNATTPRHSLAPSDIAAVQALYGVRAPDSHEGVTGNNTLATASPIPYPPGSDAQEGAFPLVVFGDVTHSTETDFYSVQPPSEYQGGVTFRLVTSGVSLLQPLLTVYDSGGNVLTSASSTNLMGDVLTVHLDGISSGAPLYVSIGAAGASPFGIGHYGLAVIFDPASLIPLANVDAVLRGPYESLPAGDLEEIFSNPSGVFFNNDGHASDTFATAVVLTSAPGYAANSHYQALGSLADDSDINFYQVTSPKTKAATDVMTVSVNGASLNGDVPGVQLFDAAQNPVAGTVLVNGNGTLTIQATRLIPGAVYYLRLAGGNGGESSTGQGNFSLTVDFNQRAQLLSQFAHGTLNAGTPQIANTVYIATTQLFQFALSASSTAVAGEGVEMTIIDQNGNVVFDMTATAGATVTSNAVLLTPGQYTVVFKAAAGTTLTAPLAFQLHGAVLSDPIGPVPTDPTMQPIYQDPGNPGYYKYPNGTVTKHPFLWLGFI